MFKRILVANRGEIAVRIIRALKEMNIESVAIYSEADQNSQHVLMADFAYPLGGVKPSESYLVVDKILAIAKLAKVDAVHPGYGFLSENTDFAKKIEAAKIKFIGPTAEAIHLLGDKITAKNTMIKANIPVVPGSNGAVASFEEAMAVVKKIGLPVMIKSSGGGGGKGMRAIHQESEIESSIKQARSEAQSSFGDPTIFIERLIENSRHIEFQVMADEHGNAIHLGERDCSIQRRHQKLVEESPSPFLSPAARAKMGEVAVNVVKASNYTSVGTVEFIVDPKMKEGENFYFLEVNTRLQVEHPVTEMVTGIDLVQEQIRIAYGIPLRFTQADIQARGSAIECRICAEDPQQGFFPQSGTITRLKEPTGAGVRVDSYLQEGDSISIYYDPMCAKLIVWAEDRAHAIDRMARALDEYVLQGIVTTIPFHQWVMQHQVFRDGLATTSFIVDYFKPLTTEATLEAAIVAAMLEAAGAASNLNSSSTSTTGTALVSNNISALNPWSTSFHPANKD